MANSSNFAEMQKLNRSIDEFTLAAKEIGKQMANTSDRAYKSKLKRDLEAANYHITSLQRKKESLERFLR